MAKNKLRRILALADPYPNWRYEVGCYLHSSAAFLLIAVGFVNLFLCFSIKTFVSSATLFALGFLLLSRLKIVRELIKMLRGK